MVEFGVQVAVQVGPKASFPLVLRLSAKVGPWGAAAGPWGAEEGAVVLLPVAVVCQQLVPVLGAHPAGAMARGP